MDTLTYSISVYGPTTLLNGVEGKMSPPVYSDIKGKKWFKGGKVTNCIYFGYNSYLSAPLPPRQLFLNTRYDVSKMVKCMVATFICRLE
jgi:hypothetical protein